MNKLIFSEGGQPVCLDDLKTLQDMIVETIKPLLLALVKTNVFILDDYDFRNLKLTRKDADEIHLVSRHACC